MRGAGAPGRGTSSEFIAMREKSDKPSRGVAGKWLIKDGDSEIKLGFEVEGTKFPEMRSS
jgi:hypothetical protein